MFNPIYISAGQASTYYKEDDYYTEKGRVTARVGGAAAERLGLEGPFENDKFQLAMKGKFEFKGKPIPGANRPDPSRAAFDCVFSPPKSCSLDVLVHDNELTRQAHIRANAIGMKFVEEQIRAAVTRDGHTSKKRVQIAYFSFDHETARHVSEFLPDPNLHTHNVIPTQVIFKDDHGVEKMYALDNALVMKVQKCADHIYKQAYVAELRMQGREVILTKDGFELAKSLSGHAYTRERLELSSKRTDGIVANLAGKGLTPATATDAQLQQAKREERNTKKEFSRSEMRKIWQREDQEFYKSHPSDVDLKNKPQWDINGYPIWNTPKVVYPTAAAARDAEERRRDTVAKELGFVERTTWKRSDTHPAWQERIESISSVRTISELGMIHDIPHIHDEDDEGDVRPNKLFAQDTSHAGGDPQTGAYGALRRINGVKGELTADDAINVALHHRGQREVAFKQVEDLSLILHEQGE